MNKVVFGLLVILTTGLMGSSFAIGKITLTYASPLFLVALRFTLAGLIMIPAVKILKRPHPRTRKQWIHISIIGLIQTAGVMGCLFVSLRTISAGESSILTFMNPLLVVIFGTIFLKSKYRYTQWLGVLLGFIGVLITLGGLNDFKSGTILGILSAVFWTISTILIKKWSEQIDIWVMTAYQMLIGGVFLLIGSYLLEDVFFEWKIQSIGLLVYLAIMASIVQFAVWFYLLQKGDSGKVSAFLFLAPFFGVFFGWLLLDEPVTWNVMIGGCLIFAGIFLVNWTSKKSKVKVDLKVTEAG